ncbi:hypothetical protein [Streptomyces sp. NPDC001744]|uniref:hypothetical protein n=1 Tax=Streptomyces sp. NPDC001744 TaxID=3364606 RepID=UPI0036A71F1E
MSDFQDSDRRQESKPAAVAHTAQDKAGESAALIGDKATDVARTAKEQAGNVVGETRAQAKDLVGEFRGQLQDQAQTQTQRLAENVRRIAAEVRDMSENGKPDSTAGELARQVADRGHRVADHLERRGPDGLLNDLQDFARRRPGVFLAGAALAGFAIARAGKGVGAASSSSGSDGARDSDPTWGEDTPRATPAPDPLPTTRGGTTGYAPTDPPDTYGQSQPPHVTHTPPVTPAPPVHPPVTPDPTRPGPGYGGTPRPGEGI